MHHISFFSFYETSRSNKPFPALFNLFNRLHCHLLFEFPLHKFNNSFYLMLADQNETRQTSFLSIFLFIPRGNNRFFLPCVLTSVRLVISSSLATFLQTFSTSVFPIVQTIASIFIIFFFSA